MLSRYNRMESLTLSRGDVIPLHTETDGDDTPAATHTHLPCELRRRAAANASTVGTSVGLETTASSSSKGAGPKLLAHHACNPSCDVYRMKRRLSQECPCSP